MPIARRPESPRRDRLTTEAVTSPFEEQGAQFVAAPGLNRVSTPVRLNTQAGRPVLSNTAAPTPQLPSTNNAVDDGPESCTGWKIVTAVV